MLTEGAKIRLERALEHPQAQAEIAKLVVKKLLSLEDVTEPLVAALIKGSVDYLCIQEYQEEAEQYVIELLRK